MTFSKRQNNTRVFSTMSINFPFLIQQSPFNQPPLINRHNGATQKSAPGRNFRKGVEAENLHFFVVFLVGVAENIIGSLSFSNDFLWTCQTWQNHKPNGRFWTLFVRKPRANWKGHKRSSHAENKGFSSVSMCRWNMAEMFRGWMWPILYHALLHTELHSRVLTQEDILAVIKGVTLILSPVESFPLISFNTQNIFGTMGDRGTRRVANWRCYPIDGNWFLSQICVFIKQCGGVRPSLKKGDWRWVDYFFYDRVDSLRLNFTVKQVWSATRAL